MSFELDGFEELEKQLDVLENLTEDVQKSTLEAGSKMLQLQYQNNLYNRIGYDSGVSQESITISKINKKGEVHVGPTTDAFYLRFLEEGFYNVMAKKYIPATPIFVPIFLQSRKKVVDAMVMAAQREMSRL